MAIERGELSEQAAQASALAQANELLGGEHYDLAVDFAPLRFARPGPTMRVYRLRNCTPS